MKKSLLITSLVLISMLSTFMPNAKAESVSVAPMLGAKVTNLANWQFAKHAPEMWTNVTVPHSCNAIDGHSSSYYRGKSYYRQVLNFTSEQISHPMFLLFEGAAQAATVSVNGKQLAIHKGAYTPFVVSLSGMVKTGDNEIIVTCDNHEDIELIPVSSDFNKNNGLHNPAYLLEMKDVYASPETYGLYRMHVSTPSVSTNKAQTIVNTMIKNASSKIQKINIQVTLTDNDGKVCFRSNDKLNLKARGSIDYKKAFSLAKPHLWNGTIDPYLYKASIRISDAKGNMLDETATSIGYRFYRMDVEKGFFLNGHSYPLHGAAVHQDWDGSASAVSNAQFDTDYEIIKELGANFLRLAHYPHNDYAFHKCDELGIIVQTEVPWVNCCGVNASKTYFANIHQQMNEMITNLYNHPSIVFWGMWNELDKWGNNDKLQGKFDAEKVCNETASLHDYAKSLDPYRYVGLSDCSAFGNEGYDKLKADYFSENKYYGWYYGKFDDFSDVMNDIHKRMGITNVSEYGVGIDPFCHSLEPEKTTKRGTGGSRHDEEYGNLYHESHVKQMMKMPFLNFTTIWVMFDFAVANRYEGYMDTDDGVNFTESEVRKFINDKGLVTRDRKIKKDVYYLYKSLWNKSATTVYITSRRFTQRPAEAPITIKVYSNAKTLTLYQNGKAIETLNGSGEETGVIWNFKPVKFASANDTFKVVSSDGTTDEINLRSF